ncbi:hypothetical protein FRC06_001216 [Ceratobasidium sp. 370]|nr:hypothetical protein FRC06_001216 [Ceratobasidium sp. 370]
MERIGGKPVIYLFPPAPMSNIRLTLALVKSWHFSALYPPTTISTPPCKALSQVVSWTVDAKPDGTLFDQRTQREVSYLFWEAQYWLPKFQQHNHIALRFLPQTEYETAAPMDVTPAPDIKTRVFMLFRGIEEGQVGSWAEAQTNATKDPSGWRAVVGVDPEKTRDTKLFRVLEWGGMEIK